MIRFILLWTAFHAAAPAADLYIDLSGDWRKSTDDRPEYSNPDWDDSHWPAMTLPRHAAPRVDRDVYWLRRKVELPADADRSDLALTIGPVREVYEVYVNGTRIGATGPFFDDGRAQIAYTRVFRVPAPAAAGAQMAIALRTRGVTFGSAYNTTAKGGSFLLSKMARAPHHEARMMIDAIRAEYSPVPILIAMHLCVAALAFVLWLAERERRELFWLALVLVYRASLSTVLFSELFPFSAPGMSWLAHWLRPPGYIPLAEMAFAIFSWRLLAAQRAAVWLTFLALGLTRTEGLTAVFANSLILVLLLVAWLRGGGLRQRWFRTAAAVIVAVLVLVQLDSQNGFGFLGWESSINWYTIGSHRLSMVSSIYFVLGAVFCLLALRRLIEDRVEKQRLSGEMEAARVVQQLLLRKPQSAGIDAVYQPATEVGGDFWQTYALAGGGQLLAVGDVSGKGLKAAMLVSLITGALRNRRSDEPAAVLSELNRVLHGGVDGGFVTAVVARFGPDGRVQIANAGHIPPYLDGKEGDVPGGLPLGLDGDATYESGEWRLAGSSQLTFVSDGVIEAANAKGELFGFERTRNISMQSAQEIAEAARAWGQNDDITVVTVRRTNA